MKSTTKPADKKGAKLPKARVMYTYKNSRGEKCVQAHKRDLDRNPWTVLLLPCHSPATAKRRLKFERLSEEEKVEAIAEASYNAQLPNQKPGKGLRWKTWSELQTEGIFGADDNKTKHRQSARALLRLFRGDAKA